MRYEAVNAMLLTEFLKEHRRVEQQSRVNQHQEATIASQQKEIKALERMLKEEAAQIDKVSDQLAAQKPPALVVTDNP